MVAMQRGINMFSSRLVSSSSRLVSSRLVEAVLIAAVAACALSSPTSARAAICGTVYGDTGDNKIVLGEQASYFWYNGQQWFYGLGKLMSCVKDSTGSWSSTVLTGCTSTTSSTDRVFVTAYAGDDQLAPNTEVQDCPAASGDFMIAWNPAVLSFGIEADMGTGSDTADGSGNDDTLYSNYPGTVLPFNPTPADSANDLLCGRDGDDELIGDKDDSASHQEFLGGGDGDDDFCNGGNDGTSFDEWFDCGSHSSASMAGDDPCPVSVPDLIPW